MAKTRAISIPAKDVKKSSLPAVIETLDDHAAAIHALGKRVITDVIEIGRRLSLAKALAGHSKWLPWLQTEFGWSDRSALNFMRVYELSSRPARRRLPSDAAGSEHALAKSENFSDLNLPVSAIYQLAAPSTPPEAVEAVVARAGAGEKMTGADVKKVVDDAKSKTGLSPPPPSDAFKRPSSAGSRGPAATLPGALRAASVPLETPAILAEKMRKEKALKDKSIEDQPAAYDIVESASAVEQAVETLNALVAKFGGEPVFAVEVKRHSLTSNENHGAPATTHRVIPAWSKGRNDGRAKATEHHYRIAIRRLGDCPHNDLM